MLLLQQTTLKIYHHIHQNISVFSLSKWSSFEKTSVYTCMNKGKSRFDWLLNNSNHHDKNGALKSAFDKHEPGSHQKIAFDIKGFSLVNFFHCSVGGQPLGWVWSVVRLRFREGLGVWAVILWKQTNLRNQSHCLERVKDPFHLVLQPWVVSLKKLLLYPKCSLGSFFKYISVILQLLLALQFCFLLFKACMSWLFRWFDGRLHWHCFDNSYFIWII